MAGRDHGGRSQPAPFLTKTWSIVSDPATDKIISWTEDGTSFIIHNQADFSRDILPSWFKHNNFSSFVRQLNIYGFKKVTSARHEFHHQCFRRDDQSLLKHIQRTSQGSNMQYEAVAYENVMLKQQIAHCGQLITWCLEQLGKVGINLPGYLQASGLPGVVASGQLPSTEGSQQQVLKSPGVAGLEGAAAAASAALPEPPQPGAAVGEEAGAEVAAPEADKADPPKFKAAPGSLAYLQQQSEMAGKRKAGEEGGCSDEDGEKGEEDGKELAASKRQRRHTPRGAEVAAAAASSGHNAAAGDMTAGQMMDPVQVSAALAAAVPGLNSAGLEAVQAALTAAGSQAAGGGMAAMPASSGVAELVALNQLLKNPGSMAALAGNPVLLQAGAAGNLQSLLGLAQAVHSTGAPLPASSGQAVHAGLLPAAANVPLPSLPPSGAAQPAVSGATHPGLGLAPEAGEAAGVAAMSTSAPMPQPLAAQPAVLAGGQQQGMGTMGQEPFLVTIPTTDGGTQLALVSNNSLVTLGQQAAPQVQMPQPDHPAPAP